MSCVVNVEALVLIIHSNDANIIRHATQLIQKSSIIVANCSLKFYYDNEEYRKVFLVIGINCIPHF